MIEVMITKEYDDALMDDITSELMMRARYEDKKYSPEEILVLLPHCMQSSQCKQELTVDISNCLDCGSCKMGEIMKITAKKRVNAVVVKGGTAARSIVKAQNPSLILAVACERELESGIKDVLDIPVIGIINERPFGPCNNTTVNINLFKSSLNSVIEDDYIV